ncbi:hypothetical protein, partial [Pseudomonas syringae group genomosp. 7]|uniref:hypothetical protein n=1 Tax=Pseudomonas syringae group genomosp. 7 TaxID=251699 RepID=UPI00376F84D0
DTLPALDVLVRVAGVDVGGVGGGVLGWWVVLRVGFVVFGVGVVVGGCGVCVLFIEFWDRVGVLVLSFRVRAGVVVE